MKKKNLSFLLIFVALWAGLIFWNLITPEQEFSQSENRYLATFPKFSMETLLDGEYMNAVDTWLNDQFAGRPFWVSSQSMIDYSVGKRELNDVYIGKGALLGDMALPDDSRTQENIDGITVFAQKYGLPCTVALVPSAATVQPQNMPTFAVGWDEIAYIEQVYGALPPGITGADLYKILLEHHEEYIYYRSDHHWTSYGAYLAYTKLASALGLTPASMIDCRASLVSDHFYGTYHSKTGFPLIKADSMYVFQHGSAVGYSVFNGKSWTDYNSIYFDSFLQVKDQYSYFLGQVQPYAVIQTASQTGRKLVVFKDSYAHSLLPLLLDDYSEICIVDLRYTNQTMQELDDILHFAGYDAALFLYSTDVFSHQPVTSKLALDLDETHADPGFETAAATTTLAEIVYIPRNANAQPAAVLSQTAAVIDVVRIEPQCSRRARAPSAIGYARSQARKLC